MSIGNRHVSHYKYFKPPLQKKKSAADCTRMPNASAEEIFQEQKIEIKNLESQVSQLQKKIKDLEIEKRDLIKVNNVHVKELKQIKEGPTDIPSLMRSHRDEKKAIESMASSLRERLRICENKLKVNEDAVSRKTLQIEKFTSALKRNEKQIKEIRFENKELKKETERLNLECKKLFDAKEELELRNEELEKKSEDASKHILELKDNLESTESHKNQLKDELNKLKKSYEELEQNFSLPKECPVLAETETQTDDTCTIECLNPPSEANSKIISEGYQYHNSVMKANGDQRVAAECNGTKDTPVENYILPPCVSMSKFPNLHKYQNGLVSHLPQPKIQNPLLKPIKSRTLIPLKTENNNLGFVHTNSSPVRSHLSPSDVSISSNFTLSNYSLNSDKAMKCFFPKRL